MKNPKLTYIIGYPASGKTTATTTVLKDLTYTMVSVRFKHLVYEDATVQLGYNRELYGGTDALSFNVQPKVLAWLPTCDAPLILGEGDRLANNAFFRSVQVLGRDLQIVYIRVGELVALRRMNQRGSRFQPEWVRSRMTKVNNLVNMWGDDIITIDGTKPATAVAQELKEVLDV